MTNDQNNDPLNFMRNIWGNMGFTLPGMVAPTFDLDELDKRIKDMKAVEGWLRMNLSMLQMTIQGLEMQRTTVSTVQAMGKMATDAAKSMTAAPEAPAAEPAAASNALSEAALWPWQMMGQLREQMQQHAETVAAEISPAAADDKPASRRGKKESS
ncbi:MAG: hypothetical protein H6R15_788 [Proteobacteria bacterium]|nr:hypothetical protein [Pseudomonadota bacterium]